MDILIGKYVYDKFKSKEKFENNAVRVDNSSDDIIIDLNSNINTTSNNNFIVFIFLLLWFLLAILAVYLSWTSNSVIGYNPLAKVFFAFFAFFFATNYLFAHVLHKLDLLDFITKLQKKTIFNQSLNGGKKNKFT